jgi:hypothetical protein
MPSPMTNVKKIQRSISQLEELDNPSPFNQRDLAMRKMWVELAGKDVVLRVIPKGVIDLQPGDVRFVEVTDYIAADMISAAGYYTLEQASQNPNATCRLATEEEVEAYRAAEEANRQFARRKIAMANAELATAQLHAVLGHFAQGAGVELPSPAAPIEPAAKIDHAKVAKQADALKDAGYDTTEKIAAANPTKLGKALGISKAKAAAMIAGAAEALADEGNAQGDDEPSDDREHAEANDRSEGDDATA